MQFSNLFYRKKKVTNVTHKRTEKRRDIYRLMADIQVHIDEGTDFSRHCVSTSKEDDTDTNLWRLIDEIQVLNDRRVSPS